MGSGLGDSFLLIWAIGGLGVVAGFVMLILSPRGALVRRGAGEDHGRRPASEILGERLARGEITVDEYERLMRILGS